MNPVAPVTYVLTSDRRDRGLLRRLEMVNGCCCPSDGAVGVRKRSQGRGLPGGSMIVGGVLQLAMLVKSRSQNCHLTLHVWQHREAARLRVAQLTGSVEEDLFSSAAAAWARLTCVSVSPPCRCLSSNVLRAKVGRDRNARESRCATAHSPTRSAIRERSTLTA